jgi:hypothetical protein
MARLGKERCYELHRNGAPGPNLIGLYSSGKRAHGRPSEARPGLIIELAAVPFDTPKCLG